MKSEREFFEGSDFSASVRELADGEVDCWVHLSEPRKFVKENPTFKPYLPQLLRYPSLEVRGRKPTLTLAKV